MHLQNFKIFIDLLETGSFTLAAQRNNITQSAVSQIVKMIEDRYGVVLVERGRKKFSVTPEGQILEKVAREMLSLFDSIGSRMKELSDVVAGKMRISTVYSIGLHELPAKLLAFRELHPEVDIQVEYKRSPLIYDDVMEGRADLGLVSFPQRRGGVMADVFDEDEMVAICAPTHRFAKKKRMKLKELQNEAFISFEPDTPTRRAIDRVLKGAGVSFARQQEFDNIETVKRAVEVAGVVSIVPKRTVAKEVAAGVLCAIHLEDSDMMRPLGILRKQGRLTTPAMREFMAVMKAP